ncbi:hypothetical protein LJY25_09960 [Hymenobacter sp. BT175]|nr:hypothetical protein [Hymenobacter translucens]
MKNKKGNPYASGASYGSHANADNYETGSPATPTAGNIDTKARKSKSGNTTKILVGASLAVLGGAAVLSYRKKSWPFQGGNEGGNGRTTTPAKSPASADKGRPGTKGGPKVDVALTNEVAESTQSTPKSEKNFTDEGATGNND